MTHMDKNITYTVYHNNSFFQINNFDKNRIDIVLVDEHGKTGNLRFEMIQTRIC
jgi:hypothetical protein